jgi:hypothetical protein
MNAVFETSVYGSLKVCSRGFKDYIHGVAHMTGFIGRREGERRGLRACLYILGIVKGRGDDDGVVMV